MLEKTLSKAFDSSFWKSFGGAMAPMNPLNLFNMNQRQKLMQYYGGKSTMDTAVNMTRGYFRGDQMHGVSHLTQGMSQEQLAQMRKYGAGAIGGLLAANALAPDSSVTGLGNLAGGTLLHGNIARALYNWNKPAGIGYAAWAGWNAMTPGNQKLAPF